MTFTDQNSNFLLFILSFSFLVSSSSFSQSKIKGDREVKIEQTSVEAFHTLSVGNDLEVVLIKSTEPSVTIEADSNLHPVINFQVRDSVLNFQITKIVRSSKEFKAIIRYTDPLKSIVLNGSVDVESQNSIELDELNLILHDDSRINATIISDKFRLENNNEASLKLTTNCVLNIESKQAELDLKSNSNNIIEINTEELDVKTYDKAELDIEGFSYKLNAVAVKASEIKAKDLLTNMSQIKLTEKADAYIQSTDTINIDISGSSKLTLYGQPKIYVDNMSDSSSLIKKEL
jgi:hypothetical protein